MVDISKCGCVAGFLFRKWGGRLAESSANPIIGTDAAELVGADPERVILTVVNLSANVVYVAPSNQVSATNGIRLNANGGSMTIDAETDGVLLSASWWGIAAAANSQLYRLSMRRVTATDQEQMPHADIAAAG